MIKKNKILVGCLVLLLALSVGYALFAEEIEINGTATAKGSFDISFECEAGEGFFNYENIEATSECTVEGQTVTTISNLPKPTENTYFLITIKNDGTIPVVLKNVDSFNNYDLNRESAGDELYYDPTYKLEAGYIFEDTNEELLDITGDSTIESLKMTLQPNEQIRVMVFHEWLSTYTGEGVTMPENGVTMTYNMTLGFEQVTVN